METEQQKKEFITMLESTKIPLDDDMEIVEMRMLVDIALKDLFDGLIYAFKLGFKRGVDCSYKREKEQL